MRIVSILAAGALACGLALAAGRAENIIYVDGNLTGVKPQSSGAVVYTSPEALQLTYGLAKLAVPYSGISKAGLSAPQQHTQDVALYKVWELHRRFLRMETQFLTVEFKDDQGEAKNMTLELATHVASNVLNAIKLHNSSVQVATLGKQDLSVLMRDSKHEHAKAEAPPVAEPEAAATNGWWGDKYWKTGRNTERWEKSSANAPE